MEKTFSWPTAGATVTAYGVSMLPGVAHDGSAVDSAAVAGGVVTLDLPAQGDYVLSDGTRSVRASVRRGRGQVYGGDLHLASEEPDGADGDAWINTAA